MGEACQVAAQHPRHSEARKIPHSWIRDPSTLNLVQATWDFPLPYNSRERNSPFYLITRSEIILQNAGGKLTYRAATLTWRVCITWSRGSLRNQTISHELFTCTLLVSRRGSKGNFMIGPHRHMTDDEEGILLEILFLFCLINNTHVYGIDMQYWKVG